MMTWTYQGWSAEQCSKQFRIAKDRLTNLFKSYIAKNLDRENTEEKYPQNRVLHWLGWLAKTMVEESKIIFLIEKMQPTLLQSRSQTRSYRISNFLTTMLIFGSVFAIIAMIEGMTDVDGSILINGLIYTLISSLINGLIYGLQIGLILGVIAALSKKIILFEQTSWSWRKAKKIRIIRQMFFGLIAGLIYGLSHRSDLIDGLMSALIGGLIGAVNGGFISTEVTQRTLSNQGILSSSKNSLRIGLIAGLIATLMDGLIFGLRDGLPFGLIVALTDALIVGVIIGLIFGLLNGGFTCIQHFNLRRILYRKGCIPWNYANLLDYASERLLLKKVGGGYVFYHRMLMEHFAQRDRTTQSFPVTPRQTPQPVPQTETITKVSSSNIRNSVPQPSNPVQNSIVCPNCAHHNPNTGKFCINCGSKLVKPS